MTVIAEADFGLHASEIERIRSVLATYPQVEQALVYGSRAKGTHRPGSDIDLVLVGSLTRKDLNQIETELDDLLMPYPLDVSLHALIDKPELLAHIRRVGRPIYRASEHAGARGLKG